jgi:hypothetical protein
MTEPKKALLFIADYTDQGQDRIFTWSDSILKEITAVDLVSEEHELVCHDFWLIAPSIYRVTKKLPPNITDIEELRILTSGQKKERESRDRKDISHLLSKIVSNEIISKYREIFNRKSPLDETIFSSIGEALVKCSELVEQDANNAGEWERFIRIERPVNDYLTRSTAEGISISEDNLRSHKNKIDFEFYMALKNFSSDYDMPLEVPTDQAVIEYLEPKGFDFTGLDVDYILNFVPMQSDFAVDLLRLRKIQNSRRVLAAIPLSQSRIYPIVDSFGSITSRIYFKDPSLQNLAKQHRNIIIPESDKQLSYIDYDQFEAGVMAAISGDEKLLDLYNSSDVYEIAADAIFDDKRKRKEAKRLFLSYAYGMKRQHLLAAAQGFGADRQNAKAFFEQFKTFETWKIQVYAEFQRSGKIGTELGNYMQRDRKGDLTSKEKRSAISQVVQGTASLIFKKTLLSLSKISEVKLKIPMHDAVLLEHSADFDINRVVSIFSTTMSEHFQHKIQGKASLSQFNEINTSTHQT